jgi:hypothetical protein
MGACTNELQFYLERLLQLQNRLIPNYGDLNEDTKNETLYGAVKVYRHISFSSQLNL